MKFKTASCVSMAIALVVGIFFFINSLHLPMTLPGIGVGAGYYPRLLSIGLILSGGAGLIAMLINKKGENEEKVTIQNPVKFFVVLAAALVLTGVWQVTRNFYFICAVADFVLLWILNPAQSSGKKAIATLGMTAILLGVVSLLFSVILQLNL